MKKTLLIALMSFLGVQLTFAFQSVNCTIDDFERPGIINQVINNGQVAVGDITGGSNGSSIEISFTENPIEQVPDAPAGNQVFSLKFDVQVDGFAFYVQNFTNGAADEWTPVDWSGSNSVSFWFYGNNSGGAFFFDILDNRNPGSMTDDAERFTVEFTDDFSGWKFFEFDFSDFVRKDIGNSAPDDGLTLTEVYGFAIGAVGTSNDMNEVAIPSATYYLDNVAICEIDNCNIDDFERPSITQGANANGIPLGDFLGGGNGSSIEIGLTDTPPMQVPGATAGNQVFSLKLDVEVGGFAFYVQNFTNVVANQWIPMDWSGSNNVSFWFYGNNSGGAFFFDILDNRNPGSMTDDAERFTVEFTDDFSGWKFFEFDFSDFVRKDIGNSAPDDGLTLTEVYGFAIGAVGTSNDMNEVAIPSATYYLDGVAICEIEKESPTVPLPFMGVWASIAFMLLMLLGGAFLISKKGLFKMT